MKRELPKFDGMRFCPTCFAFTYSDRCFHGHETAAIEKVEVEDGNLTVTWVGRITNPEGRHMVIYNFDPE